jgi:hypothetical protein
MKHEYKVFITETIIRPVWVEADSPDEAECIAEENYNEQYVVGVRFEADPTSHRHLWKQSGDL